MNILDWYFCILNQIALKFVAEGAVVEKSVLGQVMIWHWWQAITLNNAYHGYAMREGSVNSASLYETN